MRNGPSRLGCATALYCGSIHTSVWKLVLNTYQFLPFPAGKYPILSISPGARDSPHPLLPIPYHSIRLSAVPCSPIHFLLPFVPLLPLP